MSNYAVIGCGVTGLAAVEAIRSIDPSGNIQMIGDDINGYYSRPGLAFLLTGEISESQIFPLGEDYLRKMNVKRMHARVDRIDSHLHQLNLADGMLLQYDRLLIATGAKAIMPKIPGIDLDGVLKLDNLEDARWILKHLRKSRTGVVVGGGITALEFVEGLAKRGVMTHFFLRSDRFWKNVLDEQESHLVENRLQEEGVVIHYNTEVDEVLGRQGRVVGVRTKGNRFLECDVICFAIGTKPRTVLAEQAGIQVDRGILVNEHMQTSAPDVFAAGDVAQVYDPFTGTYVLDSLWGPAREQGAIAGLNMAGKSAVYHKFIPYNVTRLTNLTTTIVGMVGQGQVEDLWGIARGESETWRHLPDAIAAQSGFDVNHVRIMVGKKALLGAIIIGDQTLSKPLQDLVINQVDISAARRQMLNQPSALADLVVDLWTHWRGKVASSAR
jgi:nitrite reductase (NADH) large subunit